MGYDVAVWGSLKLPKGGADTWRKLPVDGSAWNDWTMWFEYGEKGPPRPVEQHLSEWAKFGEGSEHFTVETGPSKVNVHAFLSQSAFVGRAQSIAALFRVAERAGATGEITFAGVGSPLAFRLTLSKKGSTFEALDEDLETSPEVMKVLEAARKVEQERRDKPQKKGSKAAVTPRPAPKNKPPAAPRDSHLRPARRRSPPPATPPPRWRECTASWRAPIRPSSSPLPGSSITA
ncbi:MAG: hypothetical protein R3B70_39040 [Polyangiaceae bacterium]